VVRRHREDSDLTRYRHVAAGPLIERIDARRSVAYWIYDPNSARLSEVHTDEMRERFRYNRDANLIEHVREIDGHRFVTRYVRGARGRVVDKTLPNGQTLCYTYHTDGPVSGTLVHIADQDFWRFPGLNCRYSFQD